MIQCLSSWDSPSHAGSGKFDVAVTFWIDKLRIDQTFLRFIVRLSSPMRCDLSRELRISRDVRRFGEPRIDRQSELPLVGQGFGEFVGWRPWCPCRFTMPSWLVVPHWV